VSDQTRRNPQVDEYGSGFGPPRDTGSGFWPCLEPNRPVFALQTRSTGGLPGPVANTIHSGPHTTFSRLSCLASKQKPGQINISGVDWTTSKSNYSNRQMPYECCSLNSISGLVMIVGLKMNHISSEHYSTGIFSNVSNSFSHISHFRRTLILNQWASLSPRVIEPTAR